MKYIAQAMERMKQRNKNSETEPSVLERFLERDPNTTRAVIMALDMLLAGVDTVIIFICYNYSTTDICNFVFEDFVRYDQYIATPVQTSRRTGKTIRGTEELDARSNGSDQS
jgi:hypothetical protein